jgi:predicted enzyme related to lactoylglutathione lyase
MTTTRSSSTPHALDSTALGTAASVAPWLCISRSAAIGLSSPTAPSYRVTDIVEGTAQFGDFIPTPPARPQPGGSPRRKRSPPPIKPYEHELRHPNTTPSAAKGTVMDFVSVRIITNDVERLATFWEQLTGLPVTRPVPVFAELRTPTGTIAIGAPATVGMLGDAGPVPGQNRSVFVELRIDDVDATWERIKGLVPQTIPEIVLEPTVMPWGNRSVILRDPDGGLVNLFTPVTPEAKAKYGL